MQKFNKISALFFLSLFGLMLLHQVLPHVHHKYEDLHSQLDGVHSDDHHHHHHDDHDENGVALEDFFEFFLDTHVHSSIVNELFVFQKTNVECPMLVQKGHAHNLFETYLSFFDSNGQDGARPVFHPPDNYYNPYFTNLGLRGPPILG